MIFILKLFVEKTISCITIYINHQTSPFSYEKPETCFKEGIDIRYLLKCISSTENTTEKVILL